MAILLYTLALLAYVVAFTASLVDRATYARVSSAAGPSLWAGLLAHLSGLGSTAATSGAAALGSPSGSLAFIAALVIAGYLWTRRNPQAEAVGSFVVPLGIVLLAVALFLPGEASGAAAPGSGLWFPVHATMMLVGLGGFALAFGVSLLYLLVRRRLKQKRLAHLSRLPSLETLDRLNTRFVVLGFAALTVGIAVGGIWAASLAERPPMGPTIYGSLVIWVWYAAAIQVRVVGGWRGRLAAGFSVMGFVGLVTSLIAMFIVVSGWHS